MVRAEPLKFVEAGVFQVVKVVLLPWYNAFRFLQQNVERLKVRMVVGVFCCCFDVCCDWTLRWACWLCLASFRGHTVVCVGPCLPVHGADQGGDLPPSQPGGNGHRQQRHGPVDLGAYSALSFALCLCRCCHPPLPLLVLPLLRFVCFTRVSTVPGPLPPHPPRGLQAAMADLVQFVRKEMQGYRLYTVVPRLLDFVDQLTNWYVRLNRRRIKGSDGAAEALASITALFEVRAPGWPEGGEGKEGRGGNRRWVWLERGACAGSMRPGPAVPIHEANRH